MLRPWPVPCSRCVLLPSDSCAGLLPLQAHPDKRGNPAHSLFRPCPSAPHATPHRATAPHLNPPAPQVAATYVLVLTPTRELAVQVHSMITKLAQFTDVQAALIVGGLSLQVGGGVEGGVERVGV